MIEHPLDEGLEVVGIDEAGRGPLAGPLVVAGVILHGPIEGLDDSKKLSEKKREMLYHQIIQQAKWYDIQVVDEATIDCLNIYRATQQAMTTIALAAPCEQVMTDAMPLEIDKSVQAIVKGDAKVLSIAAASILAKVTRDHIMYALDEKYPGYGLAKHKGYPTKAHLAAIDELGVLPIHRRSYGPIKKRVE